MKRLALIAAAVLAVASCHDSAAPPTLAGEYQLAHIGPDTLPAIVYIDQFIARRVLNSYLEIDASERTFVLLVTTAQGPADDLSVVGTPYAQSETGTFVRQGDSLAFYFIGATTPVPGSVSAGRILVEAAGGTWEYRR